MPRAHRTDSTLALLRDPYRFIASRCDAHQTDAFECSILLRPTICMRGRDAAALFYDERRFRRAGAAPHRIIATLFGPRGVQALDGARHRRRKRALMSLMTPDALTLASALVAESLDREAQRWTREGEVELYPAAQRAMFLAACAWAGVPLGADEFDRRLRDVVALFDAAGDAGPRHWRSRAARARCDRWIAGLVRATREGRLHPPEGSALRVLSDHRDQRGAPLAPRVAAVAVLNIVRPMTAIAAWIVWIVHALHEHPDWRTRLGRSDDDALPFVQEVRRYYPFFPMVVAVVDRAFEWRRMRFEKGRRTLLDLYGTNHDPRVWPWPDRFDPERFAAPADDAFGFIPQGGGDFLEGHRCAGEWLTIDAMREAALFFARRLRWTVKPADLAPDMRRLPSLPREPLTLTGVSLIPAPESSVRSSTPAARAGAPCPWAPSAARP